MSNFFFNRGDTLIGSDDPEHPALLTRIASIVQPIPVHRASAHSDGAGQLWVRAAVLLILSAATYFPVFFQGGLDGEIDRLKHMGRPHLPSGSIPHLIEWFEPGRRVPPAFRFALYLERGPAGSPGFFQLSAVVLHCASVLLLWLVLRRFGLATAWFAAALFAVHPSAYSVVAWVSLQARLWALAFSLLGLLLLLINRRVPTAVSTDDTDDDDEPAPWKQWVSSAATFTGAILAFVAAVMFQPSSAVVAVVVSLLILVIKRCRLSDWAIVAGPLLFGVLLTGASLISAWRAGSANGTSPLNEVVTATGRILSDVLLIHSPRSSWQDAGSVAVGIARSLGWLIWITVPILVVFRRRVGVGASVCVIAFLLLMPTAAGSAMLQLTGIDVRDAVNTGNGYLCQIPLLVLCSESVFGLISVFKWDPVRSTTQVAAGSAMIAGLGAWTCLAASAFDSTESLFKSMINAAPHSWSARARLAQYYLNRTPRAAADIQLADEELKGTTVGECSDANAAVAIGDVRQLQGQNEAAAQWYERASAIDRMNSVAGDHLAALYLREKRLEEAKSTYSATLEAHPNDAALLNDFALFLGITGHLDQAAERLEEAVASDPDFVPAHINLANVFIQQQRLSDAAVELQTAVELDPDNFEAYHNAGIVLVQLGDYNSAQAMLRAAVQIRPESADARNDLGVVLVREGNFSNAIYEFREALKQSPNQASVRSNLDIAEHQLNAKNASNSHKLPETQAAATSR